MVVKGGFEAAEEQLSRIFISKDIINNYLPSLGFENIESELREFVLCHLSQSVENLDYIFLKRRMEEIDIKSFRAVVSVLQAAQEASELHIYADDAKIKALYGSLMIKITNYLNL